MAYRGLVYRLGTHQSAAYTSAAATVTNAFSTGTDAVRVIATTACYLKIGNTPTATSADVYLRAGVPEDFVVTPGQKASAIRVTTSGTLHVTELSA
jgi:hypothetical protein